MAQREVFVVGATRTAIGSYGGTLKDTPMTTLAPAVVKSVLDRTGVSPEDVGHVVVGNVIPTEPSDAYISRIATLDAGIPKECPAFNVNRMCGSGLQAIVNGAQSILLNECDVAIGAGVESMSRGPYLMPQARWGARLGDAKMIDYMNGILHDPWHKIHMGVTAENVADRFEISRQQMDETAAESHRRAAAAIEAGYFKEQITAIEVKQRKKVISFDTDENVRPDTTPETLGKMRAVFKEGGNVTAGNASSLNDGAAAVLVADGSYVNSKGLKPLARLVAYAHAGVEPEYMGIGPVPATKLALKRAGLSVKDLDVIEANEAFAAQACAVSKELDFDPAKVNANGSGISLGHPVGATGAIITTKALYELQRVKGKYALVTMCIGGGQGIAAIFERC